MCNLTSYRKCIFNFVTYCSGFFYEVIRRSIIVRSHILGSYWSKARPDNTLNTTYVQTRVRRYQELRRVLVRLVGIVVRGR